MEFCDAAFAPLRAFLVSKHRLAGCDARTAYPGVPHLPGFEPNARGYASKPTEAERGRKKWPKEQIEGGLIMILL